MIKKIEISHKTIIFTAVFVFALWFFYTIRDIILELFAAGLITAILNPLVEKMYRYKIPRGISIMLSYILVIAFLSGSVALVLPPLVEQTANLAKSLPQNIESLGLAGYINQDLLSRFISQLGSIPGQLVKAGFGFFSNILNVLTVLIFAFYLLLTRDKIDKGLESIFGKEKGKSIVDFIIKLEKRLGGWAGGQFLLMFLVGLSSYIGLLILGIPYALPLAILAGILEIVPYLGPIIAAVPAVILGFSVSPFLGFSTVGLAFLIQQVENYIFVPKIMEKSVGVSPIITLFALSVGFRIAGIVGAIISMPVVITIQLLFKEKLFKK